MCHDAVCTMKQHKLYPTKAQLKRKVPVISQFVFSNFALSKHFHTPSMHEFNADILATASRGTAQEARNPTTAKAVAALQGWTGIWRMNPRQMYSLTYVFVEKQMLYYAQLL